MTISQESADKETKDSKMHTLDVQVGQWVVVVYDINEYPRKVTSISDINGVKINIMHRSGSGWKWPQSKDMIFYDKNDIVCIISSPVAAGHCGQFIFLIEQLFLIIT